MKNRNDLDVLERNLRRRLRNDLAAVSGGADSLYFYNSDFNPFDLPDARLSKRGGDAYQLACEILKLREGLGEPASRDAELLVQAIKHHADQSDPHRVGAKRLAARLVRELFDRPRASFENPLLIQYATAFERRGKAIRYHAKGFAIARGVEADGGERLNVDIPARGGGRPARVHFRLMFESSLPVIRGLSDVSDVEASVLARWARVHPIEIG